MRRSRTGHREPGIPVLQGGEEVNDLTWRKSTYSGGEGGECVEVASAGAVLVRDTTDRAGITLSVPASAWRAFISGVRGS
jgi:hypothetical protein